MRPNVTLWNTQRDQAPDQVKNGKMFFMELCFRSNSESSIQITNKRGPQNGHTENRNDEFKITWLSSREAKTRCWIKIPLSAIWRAPELF